MADCKSAVSFSCPSSYLRSPPSPTRRITQLSFPWGQYHNLQNHAKTLIYTEAKSFQFAQRNVMIKGRFYKQRNSVYVVSEDPLPTTGIHSAQENKGPDAGDISLDTVSSTELPGTGGKPGLLSFYNRPYDRGAEIPTSNQEGSQTQNNLLWFVGPAVLVASFVFPSLYLRRLLSAIFEDSLLTDFLILFFTEALFYCGVAAFLVMIDRLRRPVQLRPASISSNVLTPQWEQRITSVAILVLSLTVPMVTMGLVWPWTGPAASATLAPYLVGIVVQFSFEQYARRRKSPSWSAIPIIFQIYRLHQLNRAAQLVTALSITIKGVEMTSHNAAINSSLVLLLNVLQFLGIVCIWSLSSFLMRGVTFLLQIMTTAEDCGTILGKVDFQIEGSDNSLPVDVILNCISKKFGKTFKPEKKITNCCQKKSNKNNV